MGPQGRQALPISTANTGVTIPAVRCGEHQRDHWVITCSVRGPLVNRAQTDRSSVSPAPASNSPPRKRGRGQSPERAA